MAEEEGHPLTEPEAPTPAEPTPRQRVLDEVARIAAAPDFARAPVMRRLLDFLVHATLDGRGDQLKAYAVAVDGLGRAHDFDAQADSYPRVQVGRLRRMLDAFYARDGARDGLRLSIPQGRYRVEFHPPAPPPAPPPEPPAAPEPAAAAPPSRRRTWLLAALGVAIAVLLAAAGIVALLAHGRPGGAARGGGEALVEPPVLRLSHLKAGPHHDAVEIDADAILLDGIRRSGLIRVHADERERANVAPPAPTYRLGGEISNDAHPVLRLRLTRGATGELIWTGQAALPAQRGALKDMLAPLIAQIIQPYGVIATDQRAQIGRVAAPGYPCILRYDQYRRDRNAALHAQAADCVRRTLAIDPNEAPALAAQAMLLLDEELYGLGPKRADTLARSLLLARHAVAADPYSPVTHVALARALRFAGNCQASLRSARRAITLNPYDPDLDAQVGNLFMNCDDPDAEAMLRRAIDLDPTPPPTVYPPLVFLALDRGDVAAARQAADEIAPPSNAARPFYDLIDAIVAAAERKPPRARAAWARVVDGDPAIARDPDAALRQWVLSDRMRARSLAYLRAAGLSAPATPPAGPDPARR